MVQATDFDVFTKLRARLTNQIPVDGFDFSPLADLGATRREVGYRTVLFSDGGAAPDLYVVSEGWLIGSTTSRAGGRLVHSVYQPGDLIGVQDINWTYASTTVETVGRAVLGAFPKTRYMTLFANTTRLGAALYALGMLERVVAADTARANLRLEGHDRIAHLLLTIEAHGRVVTGSLAGEPFEMPLTQSVIADAVGLSLVHTNKSLRKLHEDGFVHHDGKQYRLDRRAEMIARTGFQDRYGAAQYDWIGQMSG